MIDFAAWLSDELASLATADRLRSCPELAGSSRVHPVHAHRRLRSFASNDYLGLAAHPALAAAADAAARTEGYGASASRLVSGDLPAVRALEHDLALLTGRAAALVFPTGYHANVGAIAALAGPRDLLVSDAANHASLIDGCRLSRATVAVYPHADVGAAAAALARPGFARRFLVTESLFSMDGDAAPLHALAAAADAADAVLVVDEAHALGVAGPDGRGLCAATGVTPDVLVGTLGKAFGAAGGFVAGDPALRAFLVNRARTFIYTTALPPPVAAAASAGIQLARGSLGAERRAHLFELRRVLLDAVARLGTPAGAPAGAIVPLLLGTEARALAVSEALAARGLFLPAIRPPTVPPGTARLRITLSALHSETDLHDLLGALEELLP